MKKLSETYKELGIAFAFPIKIKDSNGKMTYQENINGSWHKYEYDSNGKVTYHENHTGSWYKHEYDAFGNETYRNNSDGHWCKSEYDSDGNKTYHEDSEGIKIGTPRNKTCEGKVVEIDGIKYELKLKN